MTSDILGLNPGNSDHLEKQYGESHRWKAEVTDEIMKMKSVALGNKHDIQIGKSQYEQLDNKIRIKNITIDGLAEEEGENLKQKIFDLIVPELTEFFRQKSNQPIGLE